MRLLSPAGSAAPRSTMAPSCRLPSLFVTGCLYAGLLLSAAAAGEPRADGDASTAFSASWLERYARDLARTPYQSGELAADNALRQLSYDDYRRIVFNPEAAIWREDDLPFQLQLFHPGFLANAPVKLHLVAAGQARAVPFTTEAFSYHPDIGPIDPEDAGGYAGFRVHHPINTEDRFEEFLVFLGASYFRGVGRDQFYGLSARGLAVNTAGPGSEEFPRFSEFWIETPDTTIGETTDSRTDELVIHALLDSPSLTGAYRFVVRPGATTVMDVEAALFPRRDIERVGIAPLTSMFLFDASDRRGFDDFRRAVHDSDGLLIQQANGETLWRPLGNPQTLQVSSFGKVRPLGFGLLQRHRDFVDFEDAEARYDKRPSLWIEPQGDWGKGEVLLVEIPSPEETHDNIVAFWQPSGGLSRDREYRFAYRMHWGDGPATAPQPGRVVETASGVPAFGDSEKAEREFVIDFSDGHEIPNLTGNPYAAPNPVKIHSWSSAGELSEVSGTLVEATGNYRVYLRLATRDIELAELRVALAVDGRPWGETWLYRWTR